MNLDIKLKKYVHGHEIKRIMSFYKPYLMTFYCVGELKNNINLKTIKVTWLFITNHTFLLHVHLTYTLNVKATDYTMWQAYN